MTDDPQQRNLHDAWNVARNILIEPKLLPGGGAAEMHLSTETTLSREPHSQVLHRFDVIKHFSVVVHASVLSANSFLSPRRDGFA